MDSTYGIASERLVNASTSYGMADPRFNGMLETITRAMGITPVSQMGVNSANEIKAIVSMVLNQLGIAPGQGEFLNMHRAVLQAGAGGYAITDMNGANIGNANAGTGNISTAVASQVAGGVRDRLSSFVAQRKGFRANFDSGMVEGLDQSTAMQMASRVLAKRRLRAGDIQLMEFNNEETGMVGDGSLRHASGTKMLEYLDKVTDVGGRYEGRKYSAEFQEMYRQADILAQREMYVKNHDEIFGGQLDLTNKKHREALEKFYKDEVKDTRGNKMEVTEADRMGIEALDRGEGKTFLVANNVTKEVSEAVKKASKNVSELSQIFNTSDLDELQAIADSMGMASITEANKVQSVRDALTRAKTTAKMTGRSVKDVMEEQAGIVSSFQMAGSSVSNTMAASVQASVYASEGVGSWKSKEQREGEAMRSQEDANEMVESIIVLSQMLEDKMLTGGASKEGQELISKFKNGKFTTREELEAANARAYELAASSGTQLADDPNYRKRAVANFDVDTLKKVQGIAHQENYSVDLEETWGRRWDSGNEDAYMAEKLKQAGGSREGAVQLGLKEAEIFRQAFGTGSDVIRDQLFEIGQSTDDKGLRESRIKSLREGLVKQNASKEELQAFDAAVQAMMGMSSEAVRDLNTTMKTYGINNATASQDTTGMSYKMKERKAAAETFMEDLDRKVVRREANGTWNKFAQGLNDKVLEGGDLTGDEATAMELGKARKKDEKGNGIDVVHEVAELDDMGAVRTDGFGRTIKSNVTSYTIGQLDETKLSQEGLDEKQREAIMNAAKEEYLARANTSVDANEQNEIDKQWKAEEEKQSKAITGGGISDEDVRKELLDTAEKEYMAKNVKPGMSAAEKKKAQDAWEAKRSALDKQLQDEGIKKDSEDYKLVMDSQKHKFVGGKREEIISQKRKDAEDKWEKEGKKELQSKIEDVRSVSDFSAWLEQAGISVQKTDDGQAYVTSKKSQERIAAEKNADNAAVGAKGIGAMAEELFGKKPTSFNATSREVTGETLQDTEGKEIKGKNGKTIDNSKHTGEQLLEMQMTAGKYVHINNEGQFTDVNGRVLSDSSTPDDAVTQKANQDLADTFDYMRQKAGTGADRDKNIAASLEKIQDPNVRASMEKQFQAAKVREATRLSEEAQKRIGLEFWRNDKEKAQAAGNEGDIHRVIGSYIDDQTNTDVSDQGAIEDRNRKLALILRAQEQGGISEMDNAYISALKEEGLITQNKDGEWVASEAAHEEFGSLIGEGDRIFGKDRGDLKDALGAELTEAVKGYGLSEEDAQEIETKHKVTAAENYQDNIIKLMNNMAHNLWALADDETSHAQAMT